MLSPGRTNVRRDREVKLGLYGRQGVDEYWIVDPRARRLEVYRLEGGAYALVADAAPDDVIESPTVAKLRFTVAALFPAE